MNESYPDKENRKEDSEQRKIKSRGPQGKITKRTKQRHLVVEFETMEQGKQGHGHAKKTKEGVHLLSDEARLKRVWLRKQIVILISSSGTWVQELEHSSVWSSGYIDA